MATPASRSKAVSASESSSGSECTEEAVAVHVAQGHAQGHIGDSGHGSPGNNPVQLGQGAAKWTAWAPHDYALLMARFMSDLQTAVWGVLVPQAQLLIVAMSITWPKLMGQASKACRYYVDALW